MLRSELSMNNLAPPSPPLPPLPPGQGVFTVDMNPSGPRFSWCTVTDSGTCMRSPDYPYPYGSFRACTFTVHAAVTLWVAVFNVEPHPAASCDYDAVTVNGNRFCGTSGPDGVQVAAGATISFTSDQFDNWRTGSKWYRFKICGASSSL